MSTAAMLARFWSKVDMAGDCWLWTSTIVRDGYGQFTTRRGGAERAHRLAFMLSNGPIPAGMCVCHRCDNPRCVNPGHLFLGTHGDNARDRSRKGRSHWPKMTHCVHGHEFTEANTYTHPQRGTRMCRMCRSAHSAKSRARRIA